MPYYASCTDALHDVRRHCPPPGHEGHEACRTRLGVHTEAVAPGMCPCVPLTESRRYYVALTTGATEPQRVAGLALFGGPKRVTAPSQTP